MISGSRQGMLFLATMAARTPYDASVPWPGAAVRNDGARNSSTATPYDNAVDFPAMEKKQHHSPRHSRVSPPELLRGRSVDKLDRHALLARAKQKLEAMSMDELREFATSHQQKTNPTPGNLPRRSAWDSPLRMREETKSSPSHPSTSLNESSASSAGRDWNQEFQATVEQITDETILEQEHLFVHLAQLARDFVFAACVLGKSEFCCRLQQNHS